MRRELSFVEIGLSVLSLLLWLLLPIFTFIIIVPLFNISGWNLCLNINQIMLVALLFIVLMAVAAVMNNRKMMIAAGLLQIVFAVLTFVLRKDILLGGNLRWIYTSAQLLLNAVPNLEISGVQVTSESLRDVVTLITDNYMQLGLGFILHVACVLVYLLIAFAAPEEKKPFSSGSTGGTNISAGPTFTPNEKTGYKHRT